MTLTLIGYLDKRLGGHYGRGPEYKWHCPACIDRLGHESATPKLHINTDRHVGHCFRCDYAFRSLESLFRYMNRGALRIEEAKILRRSSGVTRKGPVADVMRALGGEKSDPGYRLKPETLPDETLPVHVVPPHAECVRAISYLRGRGVTRAMMKEHEIGFCADGPFRGYLVFPISIDHELVYFTTRYAGANAFRKSKNPQKADGHHTKGTCLLNYDGVVGNKVVAVVEGPFDMMAFDAAVGVMGKTISPEQVALIEELVPHGLEEVVVALDPDAGLQMEQTFQALTGRVPKVSALMLDGGDPWDRREDLSQLLEDRLYELSPTTRVRARMRTGDYVRRRLKSNGFYRTRQLKR